jgi:(4S)-4-hydroxy-5-phosphonooxypentane-2,3-dione isomerase
MVRRIVKMQFREDLVPEFLMLFEAYKERIRSAKGCCGVELLRSSADPDVFFTYSKWETENDIEQYRKSELFGEVWPRTRALFAAPPEAWSTEIIVDL